MQRNCDECGTAYLAKRPSSKYCTTRCRTRSTRKRQGGTAVQSRPAQPAPDAAPLTPGVLADATRAELGPLADTADGILLLTLATRIDSVPETAPALASLSKEFAARKAELMTHRVTTVSPMDELRARRDARRTA